MHFCLHFPSPIPYKAAAKTEFAQPLLLISPSKKRNRCKTRSRFLCLLLLLFLLSCTWFSPQPKKHFPIKKIPNILYCLLSPTQNNPQKSHKTLQSLQQQMKVPTPPQAQTKKAQNVLEKYEHIHNKSRRCHLCRIFIWKYSNNFSQ